jgi:hypothetical protein
MHKYEE